MVNSLNVSFFLRNKNFNSNQTTQRLDYYMMMTTKLGFFLSDSALGKYATPLTTPKNPLCWVIILKAKRTYNMHNTQDILLRTLHCIDIDSRTPEVEDNIIWTSHVYTYLKLSTEHYQSCKNLKVNKKMSLPCLQLATTVIYRKNVYRVCAHLKTFIIDIVLFSFISQLLKNMKYTFCSMHNKPQQQFHFNIFPIAQENKYLTKKKRYKRSVPIRSVGMQFPVMLFCHHHHTIPPTDEY